MDISKRSIEEIQRNASNLLIPFYQREYTWKEAEVNKLLTNIFDSKTKNYYIGSLVFKAKLNSKIVIDGQQRMTTLWLIVKVLTEFEDKISKENLYEIKKNVEYFKYQSSNLKNSKIVEKIMKNNLSNLTEEEQKSNYWTNYCEIRKFLKTYEGRLDDFYLQFKKVVVSEVIVEEDVDEHILFAQINSTGKKLSAFDLVKNYLFSGFHNIVTQDQLEKYIDNKLLLWDDVSDCLKSDSKKNDWIRHFISFKTGILVNNDVEKIYNRFTSFFDADFEDALYSNLNSDIAFNELYRYGLIYKYINNKEWSNKKYKDSMNILIESEKTFLTILIDIFDKNCEIVGNKIQFNQEQENEINNCLLVLENYKIRREFFGFSDKNITRYIPSLVKLVGKLPNDMSYSQKLYYLMFYLSNKENINASREVTYRAPTNEEFQSKFISHNLYLTSKFCKSVLIRIGTYSNKVSINFDDFTIEHILPQNLDQWREAGYTEANDLIIEKIGTIGNLTLTHKAFNSSYSNKPFEDKKKLMFEKEEWKFNNYIKERTNWNLEEIEKRSKYLYSITESIWNFSKYQNVSQQFHDQIDTKTKALILDSNLITENNDKIMKNKSHFLKIEKIGYEEIKNILYDYGVEGNTLKSIEMKNFGMNFDGWTIHSILDYLNIKKKDFSKKYTVDTINEWFIKNDKEISRLSKYLEGIRS